MDARVRRLIPRQDLIERATLAELAEQLRQIPDAEMEKLPGGLRLAISRSIHGMLRHARPDTDEGTHQLSRNQCGPGCL